MKFNIYTKQKQTHRYRQQTSEILICTFHIMFIWYNYQGYCDCSQKKKELPHDPAIPILGVYSKEMTWGIWRDTHSSAFTSTIFTIAKIWKQFKCLLTNKWIESVWYMRIMEYNSVFKKRNIRIGWLCGWTYRTWH